MTKKTKTQSKISARTIKEIVERITSNFDVKKVILFGSYANGKPDENSDLDLLIIMNTNKRPIRQRYEIYRTLTPIHFALDIIVRKEEEIKKRISQGDWFLKEIIESGKILYAK
ncbi:MAG: nucleotidyltransferase domain-containing protein [Ignavibacteria bacterium]|nr:nucleotidyltransferase domain-containing protein [Ignavibacteria bacterium]